METQFGFGMRQRRRTRNVSLRALAKQAGLSAAYLSKVERGLVPPPSLKKITALAVALGESPEALIGLAERDRMQQLRGWIRAALKVPKGWADGLPPELLAKVGPVGAEAWHQAIQTLQASIVAGLAHGDFEFTIRGARTQTGGSTLTLNLGTIHQCTLSSGEIEELGFLFGSGKRVKTRKARR